ncbi:hypothetical protein N7523_001902 [Penicillium sp. IBT 18751x]|nr:hypothetical protein N7523_001902 [Penicillium sp. IBT 18751x]
MYMLQLQARGVTRTDFNDRRSVGSMLIPVIGAWRVKVLFSRNVLDVLGCGAASWWKAKP